MNKSKLVMLSVLSLVQNVSAVLSESAETLALNIDAHDREPRRDPRERFVPDTRMHLVSGYHFSGLHSHYVLLLVSDRLYYSTTGDWRTFREARVYTAEERRQPNVEATEGQLWVEVQICKSSVQRDPGGAK